MDKKRLVASIAGAAVFLTVLGAGIWIMIFGGIWPEDKIILYGSILLAPLCLIAAMLGYGVWWGLMFALHLFSSEDRDD
jgi:hypothetical protein